MKNYFIHYAHEIAGNCRKWDNFHNLNNYEKLCKLSRDQSHD